MNNYILFRGIGGYVSVESSSSQGFSLTFRFPNRSLLLFVGSACCKVYLRQCLF